MGTRGWASSGVGRLLRVAVAIAGVAPLALAGPGAASAAGQATGTARVSRPVPWGPQLSPARRIAATAGRRVRTDQVPATLRTGHAVQQPRLVPDPAAYARAKARPLAAAGAVRSVPIRGAADVPGGTTVPALATSPRTLSGPATQAFFDSERFDSVGQGFQYLFPTIAWTTQTLSGYPAFILTSGADQFSVYLANVAGGGPLTPGVYENAQRTDFRAAGHPGLEVTGDNRGCNTVAGRFIVDEATYDQAGNILSFSVRFEQHCDGADAALFGAVSLRATADYRTRAVTPPFVSLTSHQGMPVSSQIMVTNNGPSTLTPAFLPITGPNAGDFAVTGNTCPGTLAAGATCTVTVAYTPAPGATQQSTATLGYSDELAPLGSPNEPAGAGTGRDVALIGAPAPRCDAAPFPGLSDVDQPVRLEPPDPVVAVSANHIVEMVNTTMLVLDRARCSTTRTDLSTWFGIDPASASSGGITDPQVSYDPNSGRFFATAAHEIVSGSSLTGGGIRLAVSGVNDPTTWTPFRVGPDSGTEFLDQPHLGVTVGAAPNPNGWVMVSWNDFTAATEQFNGASLAALDKSAVVAAASGSTVTGALLGPLPSLFGIVPARQSVADAAAFAAYNLGRANFMGLIKWDGTGFFGARPGITPTSAPPDAQQPAGGTVIPGQCSSACIDTGDERLTSAVWGLGSALWTGLTDACDPGGGVRSCLRLDQFSVTDSAVHMLQDGDLGVPGWDLYYPAVEMDEGGNVIVGMTVSSTSTFPSSAAVGQVPSAVGGNFTGVQVLHQGTAPYSGQRWGDYSGAAIDPASPLTVWVADEESTTTDPPGLPGNWSTTVAPIDLESAVVAPPSIVAPPALDQLGCCVAVGSGPAISSWAAGRLDLFVRGTDNGVYHKWFSGAWSGWEAQGGVTKDNPAVVSWGPGRIDVFVRGTDNQLWHKWYDGSWHAWEPLGGTLASAPTVSTWGPGRLDIFARGTDNQLIHKWFAGGWSGWESLGGTLTSAPGAAAWAPGRIDVVARDSGNGVQHTWYDGAWHAFEALGGTSAGDPRISSWAAGRLDLWIQGPADNALSHKWYGPQPGVSPAASGWSLWTDEAGVLAGPPGAVSWAAERQDVFWVGADQNVRHMWTG